jgi:hypothetical protein
MGIVWLRMIDLRGQSAAIDRAAALLALDDPGHGSSKFRSVIPAMIGE